MTIALSILFILGVLFYIHFYNIKEGQRTISKSEAATEKSLAKSKSDPPAPEMSAEKVKSLTNSIDKLVKEAGLPTPDPSDTADLFEQLMAIMNREMDAKLNAAIAQDKTDLTAPAVNTVAPTCLDGSFFIGNSFSDAFCEVNSGNLNAKCGTLTADNCNQTNCCVWANGQKCVAGSALGPSSVNGFRNDADYYSHKYQCYGNCGDENEKSVYVNNGTVSCNRYCGGIGGGSWNNELPPTWGGAMCVRAGVNDDQSCNDVDGYSDAGTQCVCARNDKIPWAKN